MRDELLQGSTGAAGAVSESGWLNGQIFLEYLQEHFIKFVPGDTSEPVLLLLLDDHRSHVTVSVVEWAQQNNIILQVILAHTSNVLQPLDVGR